MISVNGIEITPTIFPDGTSQVWKIDENIFKDRTAFIRWDFENESEIFHLMQLVDLLRTGREARINLNMPYLPYGRQDKRISNNTTFALTTFARILDSLNLSNIITTDMHSEELKYLVNCEVRDEPAFKYYTDAFEKCGADIMAYPDDGAFKRYKSGFNPIIGHKNRDQETGYILGYKIEGNPEGKKILMVDDICDGGMTFRLMARELYKQGAEEVHLYVTHGIFSRGLEVLHADGIQRIFTMDGEVTEPYEKGEDSPLLTQGV